MNLEALVSTSSGSKNTSNLVQHFDVADAEAHARYVCMYVCIYRYSWMHRQTDLADTEAHATYVCVYNHGSDLADAEAHDMYVCICIAYGYMDRYAEAHSGYVCIERERAIFVISTLRSITDNVFWLIGIYIHTLYTHV
jgi:hypothetical protein